MEQISANQLRDKAELVLNRLSNLENRDFGKDADPWRGRAKRDFGIETWDWPQGVGLFSMKFFQAVYGDTRYDRFFEEWIANNQKQGMPSANINTTAPYLMMLDLAQRTKKPEYKQMCLERAQWLMDKLPRTKEGGFQHMTTDIYNKNGTIANEEQLWVDTLFMAVLFLARAGAAYQKQDWVDEAVYQILIHLRYLYDNKTGLLYHGWSFLRNDNFGGIYWCRGNCWFTFGILFLLDTLKDAVTEPVKQHILNAFYAQIDALRPLQSESGLWHTVLTDSDSYEEVSGTAGFTAGIYRAIREGILDESYLPCVERALHAILRNIGEDGEVANVSGGTAMGMDAEHYKTIIIAAMPYGQALAALALTEALEYYQNQEGA